MRRDCSSRLTCAGPVDEGELADVAERHDLSRHAAQRQARERREIAVESVSGLHDDAEAALALEHVADVMADRHGLGELVDVVDR